LSVHDKHANQWQRLLILLWLAVYIPSYSIYYGAWHFLQLCNLSILLGSFGLFFRSRLIISSQLLAMGGISLVWLLDVCSYLITGKFINGGAAYMWDAKIPLFIRMLSCYHVIWPALMLYDLRISGYDARALALQCAIAAFATVLGLFIAPAIENINYVFQWPNGTLLFSNPILHASISFAALIVFLYLPTHIIFKLILR
jgi:hypothetical protein